MKVWACSGICGTLVFLALSIPSSPGFQLSGISLPKVPGGKGQRLVLRESTVSGSLYLGRSGTLPCLGLGQVRSRAVGGCRSMLRMVETAGSKVEMAESSSRAAELPWKESIGGADCELLYMPFIEWQLEFLRKNVGIEDLEFDKTFERQESDVKPAIIESWQFRSKDFRKIRMTYIDAGVNAQVFNCVWYPEYTYDIPIFGIDFLSFGKKKVLAVLDFQPLTQDPEYISKYIEDVKPLREKYLDLCGRMSSRFYDENRFFSEQLLFGKFDHAGPVMRSLFPAFKQYTEHYANLMKSTGPNHDPEFMARVKELQRQYDVYSAEKDPAIGLFTTYWGVDWATRFTHEFLFSDSDPPHESLQSVAKSAQKKQALSAQQVKAGSGDPGGALWVWDPKLLDDDASHRGEFVDLYQPFWDYAEKAIHDTFGKALAGYEIPEGLEWKEEVSGKGNREQLYCTKSYAFQTEKLRQIRACVVKGGTQLQVLNFVIFPHLNYDLPILGIDLVTLPGGHLIVIDMQPLFKTEHYKRKYYEAIMDMHARHAKQLPWGGDLPEQAKQFFSPAFIWTRPSENSAVQTDVFECFKEYLHKYLELALAAEPITDTEQLEAIRDKTEAYIDYRVANDPAHAMFRRLYGEEWTDKYVNEFLFDLRHATKREGHAPGQSKGEASMAK